MLHLRVKEGAYLELHSYSTGINQNDGGITRIMIHRLGRAWQERSMKK